ncbi:MAG: aspartate aminotransferase family protein, partial [Chitinophagales bacterium]
MEKFNETVKTRTQLLQLVNQKLETYYAETKTLKVSSEWDIEAIRAEAQNFNLEGGNQAESVLQHTIEGLSKFAVQTPHPNYFGLFNPRSNFASILGDLIAATMNPQLAAWSHSPFANEIERYLIQEFGQKFGYKKEAIDGTFCTGGAESNLTAVICALNEHFPDFNEKGILGIGKLPIIYCSQESHHSIAKAAKATGLGTQAVRSIEVNEALQINTQLLQAQIQKDRQNGHQPFMIIGTAGTTGVGAIDDL